MNKAQQANNYKNIKKLLNHPLFVSIYGKQTPNKERLILATMMQESRFYYRYQLGSGPARGFGQIEPNTAFDCFENYLNYRDDMKYKVLSSCKDGFDYTNKEELAEELANNDLFNLIMLRLCYYRIPKSIPSYDEGLAEYWKEYYNTYLGKGTVKEFMHSLELLDKL